MVLQLSNQSYIYSQIRYSQSKTCILTPGANDADANAFYYDSSSLAMPHISEACLYSHPGQVRGQPPPGGTIEDAEQQVRPVVFCGTCLSGPRV